MTTPEPTYLIRLAQDAHDLRAAQRLRYEVFIEELGGDGPLVNHAERLEEDEFDSFFEHLLLIDTRRAPEDLDHVVGVYRLLTCEKAAEFGRFYSEDEYDLAPLKEGGRRLLELGRSCVHKDHRGGSGMLLLWNALADFVLSRKIEVMFGVASFHGTDLEALKAPLAYLHHNHLAPEDLRVKAHGPQAVSMDLLPPEAINRREAMGQIPPLLKAYLRLGGTVGEGAWVDRAFNTTDVCLIVDIGRMSPRHREFYTRKQDGTE